MNNLFVGISDIHLNLQNLDIGLQVLKQALNKARELKVPLVIAGDLNDTKAVMRSEWVDSLIELFTDFHDVEIEIINGNHDLNNKSGSKSSLAFLNLLTNTCVYHQPVIYGDWYFIPYCNTKEAFREALNDARNFGRKKIVCHQGFMGSFMGDYAVDDSSVDPKELEDFDIVLSGHYHRHQHVGNNIMYFGSPFTVNFGEAGHEKFIWQVSEFEGKIHTQPIVTNVRKHIQMTFEPDVDNNPLQINEHDLVKIIMKGPKEFALSKPPLDHIKSKNITLVPEILSQSEIRIAQDIIHSPIKVINNYLNNATTLFDKKALKEYLMPIIKDTLSGASQKIIKPPKIYRAIAKNFLSFAEIDYKYTAKGLTLVEGHDEDYNISTGAGKSTFFDITCYGLFGKTSKDLKADEVVNRKAGKNLFNQVELETTKGTLLVTRYRKDDKYGNDLSFMYVGQNEPTRGKDNRETQKMLEDELGFNYDTFLRSTYFAQFGDIDRFLSASDTEKKKIISEICDTKIYELMVEDIKLNGKDLAFQLSKIEKKVIALESQYGVVQGNVATYQDKSEDWIRLQKSLLNRLSEQRQDWEKTHLQESVDLRALADKFETQRKGRLDQALVAQAAWDSQETASVQSLQVDINNKDAEYQGYLAAAGVPEHVSYQAERNDINQKLDLIGKLEQEASKLNGEIHSKRVSIKALESDITAASSKKQQANCLLCYQPISAQHINAHIESIIQKIRILEGEAGTLGLKRESILESIKIKDSLHDKLELIAQNEREYDKAIRDAKLSAKLADGTLKDIERMKEGLVNRSSNPNHFVVASIKEETNQYLPQIETKQKEINPFIAQIEAEEKDKDPYISMFHEAAEKLSVLGSEREDLRSEQEQIELHIEYNSWWKDAINIYIKSYLTDSFIDQINTLANEKLSQMFDGILSLHISATSENKKTTKEKISVVIYNKNDECSYNSLSGGERCRICFALNLAISKVTNMNFGFLMFDEILNGLDDMGKTQVMKVLKDLESQYGTVFVIDHTTEFKSLFTNNIMVRKSNGISSIVI